MRFAFTSDDRIFQVPLKLEQWNRVEVPLEQVKLSYSNSMRILSPSFDKNWTSVSYEINDFSVYGTKHPQFGPSGLTHAVVQPMRDRKQIQIVLFGKPNTYGEYRYYPKPGWKITKVQMKDGTGPDQFQDVTKMKVPIPHGQALHSGKQDLPDQTELRINNTSGGLEVFCHFGDPLRYQNRQSLLQQLVGEPLKYLRDDDQLVPLIILLEQEFGDEL